jgi:hypothetical protein
MILEENEAGRKVRSLAVANLEAKHYPARL